MVVGFLNRDSVKHARFLVRRLKRAKAALRVGIVFWSETGNDDKEAAAKLAQDINADFVAHGMVDAVTGALSNEPPVAFGAVAERAGGVARQGRWRPRLLRVRGIARSRERPWLEPEPLGWAPSRLGGAQHYRFAPQLGRSDQFAAPKIRYLKAAIQIHALRPSQDQCVPTS